MTEIINHRAELERGIDQKNANTKKEVDQGIEKGQEVDQEKEKDRGVNPTRGEKSLGVYRLQKVNCTILTSLDRSWTGFSFDLKIL